eukprot:3940127-Rhodomonas_salina.2
MSVPDMAQQAPPYATSVPDIAHQDTLSQYRHIQQADTSFQQTLRQYRIRPSTHHHTLYQYRTWLSRHARTLWNYRTHRLFAPKSRQRLVHTRRCLVAQYPTSVPHIA